MQVNAAASAVLKSRIDSSKEIFCRSLFLPARWFVFSDCARKGLHCIILPNSEAAEYCANDLYNLIEGDKVFFLPASGAGVERSNYTSSLSVQRTSAVEKILSAEKDDLTVIVTFPEALEELIPLNKERNGTSFQPSPLTIEMLKYTISQVETAGNEVNALFFDDAIIDGKTLEEIK